MLIDSKLNRQFWVNVKRLNLTKEDVKAMVLECSQGKTESLRALSVSEYSKIYNHLESFKANIPQKPPVANVSDKMRKKILSICHEMKWTVNQKLDWKHINEFLLKSGYLHKQLNDYTEQELPKLVTQFEQLLKSYYAKRPI